MQLTARRLNRATLARQSLLERRRASVGDAVRHAVALQAQEPASPYVALWNRVADFDPADLDVAFADHTVVKATLMRITLHAVHVDDYATFHQAMLHNLRASRLGDRRFTASGLTIADADALVPHLVDFADEPRTKADIEEHLGAHIDRAPEPGVWWALRTFAPLVHAPTDATWTFGTRPAYVAAPDVQRDDADTAMQGLVRRYLEGFGPASVADVAQFALQQRAKVRAAIEALGDELVHFEGPDGKPMHDVPGAALPDEDVHAPPRLLGMWDSTLLAYHDRSRVLPEPYRKVVIRTNGDVLPTVLVDGLVAGVWRPLDGGIEVRPFEPVDDATWDALEAEAHGLAALLHARDPAPYSRYQRWWDRLPDGHPRLFRP